MDSWKDLFSYPDHWRGTLLVKSKRVENKFPRNIVDKLFFLSKDQFEKDFDPTFANNCVRFKERLGATSFQGSLSYPSP